MIYNAFCYSRLKYQSKLYEKYGLNKYYFSSISSEDFKYDLLEDYPWLDKGDSSVLLPQNPQFLKLDAVTKSAIKNWSTDGYAILRGFFSNDQVASINDEVGRLIREKRLSVKDKRKMMFAVKHSTLLRNIVNRADLVEVLELLLGTSIELFQSVNFTQGSEEPAHSDFIHFSTYPYGYLIAVWVALEDMDSENGPLFFYPGSHKLKYLMNGDYKHGGNKWFLGKNAKKNYVEAVEKLIEEHKLQKKFFYASKGDVLIWHANLLHGGSIVSDYTRTRKSMVMHYYGTNVIRYHEVTQRPSLKHDYS